MLKLLNMKIQVRLYGTLGHDLPDHDPLEGLMIVIPEGSNVADLFDHLDICRKKVGIISVDGNLVKDSKILHTGNFVRMYQPIFGG